MCIVDWQILHRQIMVDFLLFLNSRSSRFILKGDTSLMLCYGLTRFSEDVDLDSTDKNFFNHLDAFINAFKFKYNELSYRVGKNIDTVKRAFLDYGGAKKLKIEVSYRGSSYPFGSCNNILVYTIQSIFSMKLLAFSTRDKLRDLFDIVFIYSNYKQCLNVTQINLLKDAVGYKGLEQFDYLIKTQSDELIDNNVLAESFLNMYYDLGLE